MRTVEEKKHLIREQINILKKTLDELEIQPKLKTYKADNDEEYLFMVMNSFDNNGVFKRHLTATQIKTIIEQKENVELNFKNLGKALRLYFGGSFSKKVNKVPVKVYAVYEK